MSKLTLSDVLGLNSSALTVLPDPRPLAEENARLRIELTHARNMNAIAMTDVATARRALELEIEQNNAIVAAMRYTLKAMADALAAATAEQPRKAPAPIVAVDGDADWTPPAGLPRGMR